MTAPPSGDFRQQSSPFADMIAAYTNEAPPAPEENNQDSAHELEAAHGRDDSEERDEPPREVSSIFEGALPLGGEGVVPQNQVLDAAGEEPPVKSDEVSLNAETSDFSDAEPVSKLMTSDKDKRPASEADLNLGEGGGQIALRAADTESAVPVDGGAVAAGAETEMEASEKIVLGGDAEIYDEAVPAEVEAHDTPAASRNEPHGSAVQDLAAVHQEHAESKENTGDTSSKDDRRPSKREKNLKVEVRDQRTQIGGVQTFETVRQTISASGKETEIVVDLKTAAAGAADITPKDPSSVQFRAEKSLENFLARELHQNLNGDIVRQAQVMLRDGGEGTIRLALHPASLGNVKIHLELAGNKITGKIIVESAEALHAFERELASLEEAFRASGFEGASLDTALAGSGADGKDRRNAAEEFKTVTAHLNAARYDDATETVDEGHSVLRSQYAGNSVNLFV
jgi:flagellar hook-length control protein FliK